MKNRNVTNLVKASLFLALAIVFQVVGKTLPGISQFFVGPAVNAILILTAAICGGGYGVLVASLTPLLAWLTGQLASVLGPFLPFIIIGNIIFVLSFVILNKRGKYGEHLGVITGAFIKYIFLSISASKLIPLFNLNMPPKIVNKLVITMGSPQLITALIGGAFALILIEILTKRRIL
ncbi:ECF transporter S component [Clostridium sp. CM028]|uniref:ECF transporter S component n=1 Tax=unclassified Clostridium TaxID=2614128 RepID=UPI001C0C8131|nr:MULTISPECIES: ECF transporter S component [unclassified Clostridium]MBU3090959.1 ECF transporter S component [Clostridium sp. CF011]MBW9144475.1 ECF transporter S component [Clostridium sp. CM027]MBW9147994.1 ECF transporter S component [Clostridium sp. CM028]UVE40752.1 ECF transporter S component [Clostridium sp. CM027]WAG69723.1 ECF transporter S component [Clostridium sp. CF011]